MSDSSPPISSRSSSGLRRGLHRVSTDVGVVVARTTGDKWPARMLDVSVGGMQVACERVPDFGEELTMIVQLDPNGHWLLLSARVRWFTSRGFGVEFGQLRPDQIAALADFIAARC